MSVKTNELPQAAAMADSDSFVATTSQGTKRISLSLLKQIFGKLFTAKPEGATAGNLPVLTADGQMEDSGLSQEKVQGKADAMPPEEQPLVFSSGWTENIPSLMTRDQFSEVIINMRLKYTGSFENELIFSVLPEGFRPKKQVTVPVRVIVDEGDGIYKSEFGHVDIVQNGNMYMLSDNATGKQLHEVIFPSIVFPTA